MTDTTTIDAPKHKRSPLSPRAWWSGLARLFGRPEPRHAGDPDE